MKLVKKKALLKALVAVFMLYGCSSSDNITPEDTMESQKYSNFQSAATTLTISSSSVSDISKIDQANNTTPGKSYDNNMSTRFAINGIGEYITYDLGSSKTVGSVQIAWYSGNTRTTRFQIFTGTSTGSLTKVFDNSSSGTTTNYETYDFTDVNARYVRIVGLGNSSNNWLSINEVKILGAESGGGSNSPFNTIALQKRWKITVPKSQDGDNYADEIFIDAALNDVVADGSLLNYSNNSYFYTDGTWTYFKCQGTGKTTSGSSNPRSELREMKEGGSVEADWDIRTSSKKIMSFKVKVMQTSQSKKLCFAQIHAKETTKVWDDIIRIQVESDIAYAKVGDKGHIYIMGTGNSDGHATILSNYTLGQELDMRIEAYSSKYDVYLGGTKVYTSPKTNISSPKNYFKAGCYLQSVSSGSGGEGIVAFKSIVVSP